MLDAPLQALFWIGGTLFFRRRGDRWLLALVKGFLVALGLTFILSLILLISS